MALSPQALGPCPDHSISSAMYRFEERCAAAEHEAAKDRIALQRATDSLNCWRKQYIECQEANCVLEQELRELRVALKKRRQGKK